MSFSLETKQPVLKKVASVLSILTTVQFQYDLTVRNLTAKTAFANE